MSIDLDSFSNSPEPPIEEPSLPFPLPEQRNFYKSETNCVICKCKLDVSGLSHTIKHYCGFCYHATCGRCLSFDYYHPESKSIQLMCPLCHHKMISVLEEFKKEVSKYRLERIEVKKEIQLAIEQKQMYTQERQNISEKVRILKESLSLTSIEKKEDLEKLKRVNQNLSKKIEEKKLGIKDSSFKLSLLQQNFTFLKSSFLTFKKESEFEYKYSEKLREEYNNTLAKISIIKNKINEEELAEDISFRNEEIIHEISEISENILREKSKTKVLKICFEELLKNIKNNHEIIEGLMTELNDMKRDEMYSRIERTRLEEIKKQLSDVNDLVRIVSERRDIIKVNYERKSVIPDIECRKVDEEEDKSRLTYQPKLNVSLTEDSESSKGKKSKKSHIRTAQTPGKNSKKADNKEKQDDDKRRDCALCDKFCLIG